MLEFSLILIPALCMSSYSQTDSLGWSYFPFKSRDIWEYWVYDGVRLDTAQIVNIRDSVAVDGKIQLTQRRQLINPIVYDPRLDSLTYTIDTSAAEVLAPYFNGMTALFYKFNVKLGDQWVMQAHALGGYEIARVKEIYEGKLFGVSTAFIRVVYFFAVDSTDTLGLSRESRTLARGFGLVELFPAEGGDWYILKGAVITGVVYGDTTKIVTAVHRGEDGLPKEFVLHQNYPNPFNPTTRISFTLSSSDNISLVVYDLMGRQMKRLIENEWYIPGTYHVLWDGTTASGERAAAGVYYYRLFTHRAASTRSMIFIK